MSPGKLCGFVPEAWVFLEAVPKAGVERLGVVGRAGGVQIAPVAKGIKSLAILFEQSHNSMRLSPRSA